MNHNDKTQALYDRADELVRLCRQLDFRAIAAHQPQAVAALQRVIEELQVAVSWGADPAGSTGAAEPPAHRATGWRCWSAAAASSKRWAAPSSANG